MNCRLVMAIGAALLLPGCGGDGEANEQAELSGVLQAGNVSGVSYQTPTRDGVTDATGTFKYLAGETVTFSIGGIRLGAVPGASVITPFTLAGMTPPTTEPALRRELDRASRTTSNFVRAANIERLLLVLDADHNPTNGLDVRGRESALANASLNFDQVLPQFAANLDKLAPDLTYNMPRWYPIVHLYRAIGVAVPAHAPVSYESDDVMFFTRHSIVSYYPDGSRESESSIGALGGGMFSTTYAYDSLGRTTVRRAMSQSPWQAGFIDEERWSFDARGSLIGRVRERDEGADEVIEYSGSVAYEYDAFNNLMRQLTRDDVGHDGSIDGLHDYRVTYDALLNPVRIITEIDAGADGTIDSRYIYVSEYDSRNRLVMRRAESDEQADGIMDSRETILITYAAGNRGATEIYERDDDADGDVDLRLTYRWSYDASGALQTREVVQEYDFDTDGVMDSHSNLTVTYDRDARVLGEVQTQDSIAYVDVPVNSRRTFTYADHGGPLRVATESDFGADGEVDARYATEYEYGAGGELLSIRNTSEPAALGVPTVSGSTQVTNVQMDDGVRMLAQQYFEFWYSLGQVSSF